MKRSQASTVAIATKLSVVVASLLGCSPPVTATPEVCVLAPHIEPSRSPPSEGPGAVVPIRRPTLFVREPLAELRVERGARVLWSWRAEGGDALEGPLAWPLQPLEPGQVVTVRLRPLGASPDHFASIHLRGAPLPRLNEGEGLLQSLASKPAAWRSTIDGLLAKGDRSLATALLFAQEGPNVPDLNALRLLVAQQSCP